MRWYKIVTLTLVLLGLEAADGLADASKPASVVSAEATEHLLAQASNRPTLRLGSVGDAVSELQAMLQLMGYYSGPIDGFYREQTQAGVVQFQEASGITADGIVGPSTWQKLFPDPASVPTASAPARAAAVPASTPATSSAQPTQAVSRAAVAEPPPAIDLPILREGMFGPAVSRLQERLKSMGFYQGELDGMFGPQTAEAVQALQRRNSLSADGIVGPATWAVIFR